MAMRLTTKSAWTVTRRVVGLFLLGVFLQWIGMTHPAAQEGTIYSEIAHLTGAGASGSSLAKLPPQQ
jgi:hypothetical protein